ncbi:MAG: hypothetical protein ABIH99_00975 [Candidatus Micrarchaeota archaeon]
MNCIKEVCEHFKSAAAFTITDLKVFLRKKGVGGGYLSLLVHNLLAKHEMRRIARGVYTFHTETEVAGFGFRPFYYGLQEALSLRNLWEQETNPVVITPRKVRSGVRTFEGANYVVRRINRRMFFGFEMMKYADFWIPVSDVEKTFLDFVYFKQALSREALAEIKKRANEKTLNGYLKRCPKWMRKKARELLKLPKPRIEL